MSEFDFQEVLGYYEIARSQFPGADVQSSSLEAFVEALTPYKSKLPVITKEFGDTWIQGSASDPRKVAEMRAVFRARTKCLQSESGLFVIFVCFFTPYVIVQCSTLRYMYKNTCIMIMICYNQLFNRCDIPGA